MFLLADPKVLWRRGNLTITKFRLADPRLLWYYNNLTIGVVVTSLLAFFLADPNLLWRCGNHTISVYFLAGLKLLWHRVNHLITVFFLADPELLWCRTYQLLSRLCHQPAGGVALHQPQQVYLQTAGIERQATLMSSCCHVQQRKKIRCWFKTASMQRLASGGIGVWQVWLVHS